MWERDYSYGDPSGIEIEKDGTGLFEEWKLIKVHTKLIYITTKETWHLHFSSPEPKTHGELIVYQSSRRLCVYVSTLLH